MSQPQSQSELVALLSAKGVVRDDRIRDVLLSTDRAIYVANKPASTLRSTAAVSKGFKALCYWDRAMGLGYHATISAPRIHASALQLLKDWLVQGASVLDVGCGSGYLTACMGRLVGPSGSVYGLEHIPELAEAALRKIQADDSSLLRETDVVYADANKAVVTDASTGIKVDTDASMDTKVDTNANAETKVDTDACADTKVNTNANSDTKVDTDANSDTKVDADANSDTNVDADVNVNRTAGNGRPKRGTTGSKGCITIVAGDGRIGYAQGGPYDVIYMGAAAPEVPPALLEQLAPGGRLLCPVGPEATPRDIETDNAHHSLVAVDKTRDGRSLKQKAIMGVIFIPLTDVERQFKRK